MEIKVRWYQNFTQIISSNAFACFIQFPVTRIVIAFLFIVPAIAFHNILALTVLNKMTGLAGDLVYFCESLVFIFLIFYLYRIYTRVVEARQASELSFKGGLMEFVTGMAVGAGLVTYLIILLSAFECYSIEKVNEPYLLLYGVFRYGTGAFIEEVILTIILYKLAEELLGTTWAVFIISLLFGLAHAGNNNVSIQNILLMSLSHLLVLAYYILMRRIWVIWALHFGWNYFQTAVFGLSNSGIAQGGFITPVLSGPGWFTGGIFGIEASFISVMMSLIAAAIILYQAVKSGQLVKPSWKRN